MASRREHGADARIGGRSLCPAISPGLQVSEGVDDAASDLAVARTGAIRPVFFERSPGQTKKPGGFRGSKVAWRKVGGLGDHRSRILKLSAAIDRSGAEEDSLAKWCSGGGCRRRSVPKRHPG